MELYLMMSILDRNREKALLDIHRKLNIPSAFVTLGSGTATTEHLNLYNLEPSEKSVVCAVATADTAKKLFFRATTELYMDIPGNGIMMAIPLKSIGGGNNLSYLTNGQKIQGGKPDMKFEHELIVVVLNEGHSDTVMDVARNAGATGGTSLHAKGTGIEKAEKFYGVSLAEEKDIIYILSLSEKKSQIMKAINENCGTGTPSGAVCFSLPVSEVTGLRRLAPQADPTE